MDAPHIKYFAKSILIVFLIKAIFAIIISVATLFSILDLPRILGSETSIITQYGVTMGLILGVVIGPIIEELAFRGWLSGSKQIVAISLVFFLYYILLIVFNILRPNHDNVKYYYIILIGLVPAFFLWIKRNQIFVFIDQQQKILIRISIILFTAVHAFNYSINILNWSDWTSLLILLLPYPPIAYILTNIRIKNGLIWSILLHVCVNSILIVRIVLDYKF